MRARMCVCENHIVGNFLHIFSVNFILCIADEFYRSFITHNKHYF